MSTEHADRMKNPQFNTQGAPTKPIRQFFSEGYTEKLEYKDTYPEDLPTIDEVKKKYGTVVWCKFTKCKWNERVQGLQRTTGTVLKNRAYNPLSEQEHIWTGVCGRDEIGIKYDEVRTSGGSKVKVPSCFSAVTGVTGHMDFSKLLQPDGSPFGGSIDSQHATVDKSFEGYIE